MSSVSSKKTYNLFCEALGGNKFIGAEPPGSDWSPNNYKSLHILPDGILVEYYVGDMEMFSFVSPESFDPKAMLAVLDKRKLSKLETITIHNDMGGKQLASDLSHNLIHAGYRRLHRFGELNLNFKQDENGNRVLDSATVDGAEIIENAQWFNENTLEPEHYEFDSNPKLLEALLVAKEHAELTGDSEGDLGDEVEDEVEDEIDFDDKLPTQGTANESEDDEIRQEIERYFKPITKSTIDTIIRNYSYIFASGYEVIKPRGMMIPYTREGRKGKQELGGLFYLDEENHLKLFHNSFDLEAVYNTVKKYVGELETLETRVNKDIALHIAKNSDTRHLYLPYKMIEYAYGRKRVDSNTSGSLSTYEPHSDATSWEEYVNKELRPSLEDIMLYTIYTVLTQRGVVEEIEDITHEDARGVVTQLLKDFEKALCKCFLLSKFEESGTDLVSIKLRVLDPYNRLPRDRNIISDALRVSRNVDVSQNPETRVFSPVTKGEYFVEYQIDIDEKLAQAEPLFSYKALEVIKKQGKKLSYDTAILGKGIDDSIITNGNGISFRKKLSHCTIAGSRAGKGVWTNNTMAACILSGRALAYMDNKPDIGDMLNSLADNVFVINGGNLTYKPEEGTGYFGTFKDVDSWINPDHVPQYLQDSIGGARWAGAFGTIVYVRSTLLWLGILSARASSSELEEKLGGKDGITLIADEVANTMNGVDVLSRMIKPVLANTGYVENLKAEGEEKAQKMSPKPTEMGYWGAYFTKFLYESAIDLSNYDKAGFKNGENTKSDIFIILQDPLDVYDISSVDGKKALFPQDRNKNTNGIAGLPFRGSVLSNLLLRGESDLFAGYHPETSKNYLGIHDTGSYAAQYINPVSRNFGYVENYDKDRLLSNKDAHKAIYYKPMLIFPDGKQDAYFVQNALGYIESTAGVPREKIIERNSDPEDSSKIHPAVGFKEYLNMAGLSDDDISNTLNQSGDIADWVVTQLGYPDMGKGTWRHFITDMRPEWMFSTADIVKCLSNGTKLSENIDKRLYEFVTAYPDMFESAGVNAGDAELNFDDYSYESDEDDYLDDNASGYVDLGDDEDGDGVPDHLNNQPEYEFSVDDTTVPLLGSDFYRHTVYEPEVGTAEDTIPFGVSSQVGSDGTQTSWTTVDLEADTAPLPTSVEDYYGKGGEYYDEEKPVTTKNILEELQNIDIHNPESVKSAISSLFGILGGGFVEPGSTYSHVAGTLNTPKAVPLGSLDTYDLEDPRSLALLRDDITRGMYSSIGGPNNFRTLAIVDDDVIINHTSYRPKFKASYIQSLPVDLKRSAATGKVAGFVNWTTLKRTAGKVTTMAFDSDMVIRDNISPAMGWKGRISVPTFFRTFPSLQRLTIGSQTYTRQGYRRQLADAPQEYVDNGTFLNLTDKFSARSSAKGSEYFSKVREGWGRDSTWKIAFNLTSGTLAKASTIASKTASGATRVGSSTLSRLRYALSDVNQL